MSPKNLKKDVCMALIENLKCNNQHPENIFPSEKERLFYKISTKNKHNSKVCLECKAKWNNQEYNSCLMACILDLRKFYFY